MPLMLNLDAEIEQVTGQVGNLANKLFLWLIACIESRHITEKGYSAFVEQAANQYSVQLLQQERPDHRIVKARHLSHATSEGTTVGQDQSGPEAQTLEQVKFFIEKQLPIIFMDEYVYIFWRAKIRDVGMNYLNIAYTPQTLSGQIAEMCVDLYRINLSGAQSRHVFGKDAQPATGLDTDPISDMCVVGIEQSPVRTKAQVVVVNTDERQQIVGFLESLFRDPVHYIHTVHFGRCEILSILPVLKIFLK